MTDMRGNRPKKTSETQSDIARRALAMKKKAAAEDDTPRPDKEDHDARHGMHPEPNEAQAPSGALDHAGALPAMQRSKFAR